jgi:hypothetical protein
MMFLATLCRVAPLALVAGCNTTGNTTINLYPVRGPWALEAPLPIITAAADGIGGPAGTIKMTMPDQETCMGQWSSLAGGAASTPSLFAQYGVVAGFDYIKEHPPGTSRSEVSLTCSRGTTVQAEFFTGKGEGYGVARDSSGNIYRILF